MKVGLGLAAAAAAAAGVYYFYGKDAPKRRRQLKGWMVTAKGEVMDRMEKLPEVSELAYRRIVAEVLKRYKNLKNVSSEELAELSRELLGHWKSIKTEVDKVGSRNKPARRTKK